MNQLGPMLPSAQGLSRLVCDSPRQLALSCKVRISTDYHDHDTTLIYIKSIVKFPQSPHTKKATGATEVSLSRAHPWRVWLAQAHFSLGIVSPSTCGIQPVLFDASGTAWALFPKRSIAKGYSAVCSVVWVALSCPTLRPHGLLCQVPQSMGSSRQEHWLTPKTPNSRSSSTSGCLSWATTVHSRYAHRVLSD